MKNCFDKGELGKGAGYVFDETFSELLGLLFQGCVLHFHFGDILLVFFYLFPEFLFLGFFFEDRFGFGIVLFFGFENIFLQHLNNFLVFVFISQ